MKYPIGIQSFEKIRKEGFVYVDKTDLVYKMVQGSVYFLARPRRFGKSIFLSMLRAYYDIKERDNFQSLFEGLWIADHPTENRGRFQVMYFDFSRIGGTTDVLERNFDQYCSGVVDNFVEEYQAYYQPEFLEEVKKCPDFRAKINYINMKAYNLGHPLYLIIDEYDNFTNTVLNEEGEGIYHGLTHASGFYRETFKQYKPTFSRILMMGVSPVTMDDLTSGFNIASNISTRGEFNMMLGFSETDVRGIIRYYQSVGRLDGHTEESLLAEMKPWYDGYCFSEDALDSDPKMFNCDMVLYYLNRVMQTGESPEEMIDPNTRTDYAKMRRLIQLDTLDNYRRGIIHQVSEQGYVMARLQESFDASRLADRENFISLLFYYGMLTIGGIDGADLKLVIPNNNVRRQYYDWLLREYQSIARVDTTRLNEVYDGAALRGEWRPMLEALADAYRETTSVRQLIEGERNLQGFMTAYLSFNPYYLVAPEVELSHGYCDFFLLPDFIHYPMVAHSYILELKYLKADATKAEAEKQWAEAEDQIRGYAASPRVRQLAGGTQLHLLILQIRGYELERYGIVE